MEILVTILCVIGLVCLIWRLACKRYNIPWPHWLAWVLRNPYMLIFCHPEEIASRVNPSAADKVLDLGCGAGRISVPIAKRLSSEGSLLGIDLQATMISKANRYAQAEGVDAVCDFRTLDIITDGVSQTFDKIVIVTVLGEIPNVDNVLEKVHAMLKPSGSVSITEVIPDPCYITKRSLRNLLEEKGFVFSELFSGPLSYTMNFKKL